MKTTKSKNKKSLRVEKKIYKIKKEKILVELSNGLGVKDSSTGTLINLSINANKKVLADVRQEPYFHQGNFVLYNGDSLNLLKELPENSVDMIFNQNFYEFNA